MTALEWQYQNEREWQRYVVELAKAYGWRVFHVPDSRRTTRGWPDLALLRVPDFMLVELKTNTGKLSTWQRTVIDELQACGIEVHVWRPEDQNAVCYRLMA